MTVVLSDRENLLRAIRRDSPQRVPYRRLDGSIAGLHRMIYRDSRALLSGTDRWGVTWAGGVAAKTEWGAEIQGYPVDHPLKDLADIDTYPFPDPDEPGILDGLLDGVDRSAVLLAGEICFPVQDRAHLLMGIDRFCMAAIEEHYRLSLLLRRIADYQIGIIHRYLDMGADIIRGLDDYGGQSALLLGPPPVAQPGQAGAGEGPSPQRERGWRALLASLLRARDGNHTRSDRDRRRYPRSCSGASQRSV